MNISFGIITLNEAENLARCLKSCAGLADEIVVLDSGSTDGTCDIARAHGARLETRPWQGYVSQRNHLLSLARNEWVFAIDADEELSPRLRAELLAIKEGAEPDARIGGYSMPRCVCYEGRWIRHGSWYPDRLVRLFRRDRARYVGGKVHERLEVSGQIVRLRGDLHHFSFRDAQDHWQRCQKYARLWAESRLEEGRTAGPLTPALHAAASWLRGYLLKGGFLDGLHGLRIATTCAREVALKYRLLRALRAEVRANAKDL